MIMSYDFCEPPYEFVIGFRKEQYSVGKTIVDLAYRCWKADDYRENCGCERFIKFHLVQADIPYIFMDYSMCDDEDNQPLISTYNEQLLDRKDLFYQYLGIEV